MPRVRAAHGTALCNGCAKVEKIAASPAFARPAAGQPTVNAPRSAWRRYAQMLPYIRRQWRRLALIGCLTVLSAGVSTLVPWPLKLLVDYALGSEPLPVTVVHLLPG